MFVFVCVALFLCVSWFLKNQKFIWGGHKETDAKVCMVSDTNFLENRRKCKKL